MFSFQASARLRSRIGLLPLCLAAASLGREAAAADIQKRMIDALDEAFADTAKMRSQARQRLAIRRMIRDGKALLEDHPTASNRFRLLATLYRAHQRLVDIADSTENREALLDICRQLIEAPDTYIETRLEAELLLSQAELVRQGAGLRARADALRHLVARYRNSTVEPKVILRDLGVDWPALRLPGGKDNPIYRAYVRRDPAIVTVTPTGYAALHMVRGRGGGRRDYSRWLGSSMARGWTKPLYTRQLQSVFIGEFLILDPRAPFDPGSPPETKTSSAGDSDSGTGLARTAESVPKEKLRAIQECFVAPPLRYRMPPEKIRAKYERAETLCREVIAAHPCAPDLWIVRNRRMIALLGLWKLGMNQGYLERAVGEARAALAVEAPRGADVVARFCLARERLCSGDAGPETVIGNFFNVSGRPEKADGPALAVAAILALDAGDRMLHERYRRAILDKHADNPAIWQVTATLLDRYHRYWLYRAPYVAGWSFGRRESYFLSRGKPDDASRLLRTELKTIDGDPFRIPEDTCGKWTVILFMSQPGQGIPRGTFRFSESRPFDDVNVIAAVLDDDAARVGTLLKEKPHDCPTVLVPRGLQNPIIQKLGIVAADKRTNVVILRPDNHIAVVLSGLALRRAGHSVIQNVIEWHDEKAVDDALNRGDLETARHLAFTYAPLAESAAPDPKKQPPPVSLAHLRSRAKVYMAMEMWEQALADLEQVAGRQRRQGTHMSLEPPALRKTAGLLDAVGEELELDGEKGASGL